MKITNERAQQYVGIACLVMLLGVPVGTHASDIGDFMDSMYMSTSTSPTTIRTQTRGGMVGGHYSLRAPIKRINLVHFAAPGIHAGGCGGIDLYGGSFSYLNKDAIIQAMRQIGANALAMAFSVALRSISSLIADVVEGLQEKVEAFNRMFRNTCQIAKLMVPEDAMEFEGLRTWADEMGKTINVALGRSDDHSDEVIENQDRPGASAAESADMNPAEGNQTWLALEKYDADEQFRALLGTSSRREASEIVMSIFGTVVSCSSEDSTLLEGTRDEDGTAPGILRLKDFFSTTAAAPVGEGDASEGRLPDRYVCLDDDCCTLDRTPMEFQGFRELVQEMMNELETLIITGDVNALEEPQIVRFVNATKFPVASILGRYSHSHQERLYLKAMLVELVAEEFLIEFGNELLRLSNLVFTNTRYVRSEAFREAQRNLIEDLRELQPRAAEGGHQLVLLYELVERLDRFRFQTEPPVQWHTSRSNR